MQNRISKTLLYIAAALLALGIYVRFNATNDCDLSDTLLVLWLPGFVLTLIAGVMLIGKVKISSKSRFWFFIAMLLCGFIFLGFETTHLRQTAVGDCS
jgi:lipopolysaccharide export LptBFGC system permease protein LptF